MTQSPTIVPQAARPSTSTAPAVGPRRWLVSLVALIVAIGAWAALAAVVDDPILPPPGLVAEQVVAIVASGS